MKDSEKLLTDLDEVFLPPQSPALPWFAAAFGLLIGFLALSLPTQVVWKTGRALIDQPGFWSVLSIAGMVAFGVPYLWVAFSSRKSTGTVGTELSFWLRALEYVAWFLIYTLTMNVLGYLPSTLLFCVLLAVRSGYRSRKMLVWAAATAVGTVVVFKSLLSVKIPGGMIYEYLPGAIRNFMIQFL